MARALRLEDIEEFELVRAVPPQLVTSRVVEGIRKLDEREEIEPFLCRILADFDKTPHGSTEIADLLTDVTYYGKNLLAAFVIKGKSSPKVKAKDMSHQLVRIRSVPGVDLIALVAVGHIQDDVKRDLSRLAKDAGADHVIAGATDLARLFIGHGFVCPVDGRPYRQGACPECGRDEAEPLELIWRVREEPRFEVLQERDVSHVMAKRLSGQVLTDPHYTKPVLRQVIKAAMWHFRQGKYCRSEQVKRHFGDRAPDCILLFFYVDADGPAYNNWVCRAAWNREDLRDDYRWRITGQETIGGIAVDWNESYYAVKEHVAGRRISKAQFAREVEELLPRMDQLVATAKGLLKQYDSGQLAAGALEAKMAEVQKEAGEVHRKADLSGWPPYECAEADGAFASYALVVDNIFFPFAEWIPTERSTEDKIWLMRDALSDLSDAKRRFEYEWTKIR